MKGFEFDNPLDKRVLRLGASRLNPEFGEVRLRAEKDDTFSLSCGGDSADWLDRKILEGCFDRAFGEDWTHFETSELHRIDRGGNAFKRSGRRLRKLKIVFTNGDERFLRCRDGRLIPTIKKKKKKKKPDKKKKGEKKKKKKS